MKSEITLALTFLIGLTFKFSDLPGASILIVYSLSILTILYFPFGFYFFSDKKIKTQNLPLSIISGLMFSSVPIAILLKIQYWEGAMAYSYIGAFASALILIIIYALKKTSLEGLQKYYTNMLRRATVLTGLSIFFLFVSTKKLVYLQYRQDPRLANLKYLHYTNPDNQKYIDELDSYLLHETK